MPSIDVSVEIEIWCANCGAGLCNQSSPHRTGQGFDVEPCQKCLDKDVDSAREEGEIAGYDKGKAEGIEEGREAGRAEAQAEFEKDKII